MDKDIEIEIWKRDDEIARLRADNGQLKQYDEIAKRDLDLLRAEVERLQGVILERGYEIERLRAQLPEGMEHCTIMFKECEKGHGRLTAQNWIQHECEQCKIERLQAALTDYVENGPRITKGDMDRLKSPADDAGEVIDPLQLIT